MVTWRESWTIFTDYYDDNDDTLISLWIQDIGVDYSMRGNMIACKFTSTWDSHRSPANNGMIMRIVLLGRHNEGEDIF